MINEFKKTYINNLNDGLDKILSEDLTKVYLEIESALYNHRDIFVCGNGGSASISEHFSCDHSKGVATNTEFLPKIHSLSSNMSLLTALANDNGYEEIFSAQLLLQAKKDDVLVVISSSGNSPNIIRALEVATQLQMKTVALTGFTGGKAKELASFNLHIPVNNYGIVEDCHQILMHILAQYIRTIHTTVDIDTVKL